MILRISSIKNGILLSFLMIMVFSLTLSYFDATATMPLSNIIIESLYLLKKVLFVLCLLICVSEKTINKYSIVLCVFFLIAWGITSLFFSENNPYIEIIKIDLICAITSFIAVTSGVVDLDIFIKDAIMLSRALIIICLCSLLAIDDLAGYMSINYMVFSNAIMVPIGFVIYSAIVNIRTIDYILGFGGTIFLLFLGSRGAFLALALLLVILFLIQSKNIKTLYGLFIIPILLLAVYYVSKSNILGVETSRILQKISNGTLFSMNDRLGIWRYLLECCSKDVFLGHGLCADRYYLPLRFSGADSTYAHNIFIELLVDFGIIGLLLIVYLIVNLIKYFKQENDDHYKMLIATFFFVSFFQLLYSRSFLTEANLFIMFGILLTRLKYINSLENIELQELR